MSPLGRTTHYALAGAIILAASLTLGFQGSGQAQENTANVWCNTYALKDWLDSDSAKPNILQLKYGKTAVLKEIELIDAFGLWGNIIFNPPTARTKEIIYLHPVSSLNEENLEALVEHLNVTDQNIVSGENANPVITLRTRYDRWKAGGGARDPFDASGG